MVLGIWIASERMDENYGIGFHGIHFNLIFGNGTPGEELFHSSRELTSVLESNPGLIGKQMGFIKYRVNDEEQYFERESYYPYAGLWDKKDPIKMQALEALKKRGLASTLWQKTVELMGERYPDYRYKEAFPVMYSQGHAQQLEKMEITPGQIMPVNEVLRKMEKWRGKKRRV